jgi:hypothetical protein
VLSVAQPRGSADPARDVLELGEDECGARVVSVILPGWR